MWYCAICLKHLNKSQRIRHDSQSRRHLERLAAAQPQPTAAERRIQQLKLVALDPELQNDLAVLQQGFVAVPEPIEEALDAVPQPEQLPPEYNPNLRVDTRFEWDHFLSPFGPPSWPEVLKDRYCRWWPPKFRQ